MKNLIRLVKINVLNLFDLYKLFNAKTLKDYQKAIPKLLLYLLAFVILAGSVYDFSNFLLKALIPLNSGHVLLVAMMALSSAYLVISTVFKVNKTVFDAKDYSILLGLPIKKWAIINSKVILLYISNLLYTLLFMVPAYAAYVIKIDASLIFHFLFFISLLFIPVMPTIVGTLIGSLMTAFIANFKYKNLMMIIVSFFFMLLLIGLSFLSENITADSVINISNMLVNYFNNIYPLTQMYTNIIYAEKLLDFVLFLIISIGAWSGYTYVLSHFFDKINSKLNAVTINNRYQIKQVKIKAPFKALYFRELRKYLSSVMYVLNTSMGAVLLIASLIAFAFFGSEQLEKILSIPGISKLFSLYGPLIFSVFCSLSCTTNASISLEGKTIWLLKTLPIKTAQIFWAKILVNLTILVPTIIIGACLLTYILSLSFLQFLLLLFTPIIFSVFISGFGLLMNLLLPDFEWTNEIKVIKQSLSVLITIMMGMAISITPLLIKTNMNTNLYSLTIGLVNFIILLVTYYFLFTKGKELFKAL